MSEFRTRNLGLAGFLAHIGFEHLRTELLNEKVGLFVFNDPHHECDQIKRDYFGGAGCEDAQLCRNDQRRKRHSQNCAARRRVETA